MKQFKIDFDAKIWIMLQENDVINPNIYWTQFVPSKKWSETLRIRNTFLDGFFNYAD